MMSSENIPPVGDMQAAGAGGNRKGSAAQRSQVQEAQPLKCPRCDSANTKFCYYNNYSLSQPRHFCKTCRRYWTKGGALRNVPIGGGCRKTKKMKPSSAASTSTSRLLSTLDQDGSGFKFMGPAMEFQLGGLSLPRLHPATAGVYSQFVSGQANGFGLDLLGGLNYPAPPNSSGSGHANTTSSALQQDHNPISLSSIESLSSINQEMHWKLQQQRLAMIYANNPTAPGDCGDDHQDAGGRDHDHDHHSSQKQQIKDKPSTAMNLFQSFEISTNDHQNSAPKVTDHHRHHHHVSMANNHDQQQQNIINCGGCSTRKLEVGPTEWFFDQATNYAPSHNSTDLHLSGDQVQGGVVASWGDLHHFNGLQ